MRSVFICIVVLFSSFCIGCAPTFHAIKTSDCVTDVQPQPTLSSVADTNQTANRQIAVHGTVSCAAFLHETAESSTVIFAVKSEQNGQSYPCKISVPMQVSKLYLVCLLPLGARVSVLGHFDYPGNYREFILVEKLIIEAKEYPLPEAR